MATSIGVGAFLVVVGLRFLGALQPVELALYDYHLRQHLDEAAKDSGIRIVLIGEEDIRRFGHPLRDELLMQLIQQLMAAQPRAIGIDLYRDMPVPAPVSGDLGADTSAYRALGEVVNSDPRVVMVMTIPSADGRGMPPPRFLADPNQAAFGDILLDPGGIVRRYLLSAWVDERPMLSLAMAVAIRSLFAEGVTQTLIEDDDGEQIMQLGPTPMPPLESRHGPYVHADAEGYQFLMDFRSGAKPFPSHGLGEVLAGRVDPSAFRDRIVLVGTATESVKDYFYTPLSRGRQGDQTMVGVAVHAHAAAQLLRFAHGEGAPISVLPTQAGIAWVAFWSLLGAWVGSTPRSVTLMAAGGILASGLIFGLGWLLFSLGWWIPVVAPMIAGVGSAAAVSAISSVLERRERRQLLGLFSRFQGAAIADEIWKHRAEFLGPEGRPVSRRVTLTSLMADLEGYTAASEKMEPRLLMSWVNEYMEAMAVLVEEHGGVVDDYAGDGVKANFGFPVPSVGEDAIRADAEAAVRCALAMGRRMEELNASWRARGLPTGRCRVGIATGPAVVGCIGADRSMRMTSVGDTVNTAARLESFGKEEFRSEAGEVDWRVLVADGTLQRVRDAFEWRSIGAHVLKGKGEPVAIHRVLDTAGRGAPAE